MDQLAEDYRIEKKELSENRDSEDIEYVHGIPYNITLAKSNIVRICLENEKNHPIPGLNE